MINLSGKSIKSQNPNISNIYRKKYNKIQNQIIYLDYLSINSIIGMEYSKKIGFEYLYFFIQSVSEYSK